MFSLVFKTQPPSTVEPAKRGFSTVLKANPYHDGKGRFTSKEKAAYQSGKLADTLGEMSSASDMISAGTGGSVEDYLKSPVGKKMVAEAADWHWKLSKNGKDAGMEVSPVEAHTNLYFGKAGGAVVAAKIQASLNAKKAWIKIYQKKSMDYLEGEYVEDMAQVMQMQDGLAKDKLVAKIKKKYNHAKEQFVSNGGDEASFMDATQTAYSKLVAKAKASDASPPPKVADEPKPSAKWSDPDSGGVNAMTQNETLGSSYYKLREKLGKDHPEVQEAYAEWQKAKDYIKAKNPKLDIGALSSTIKTKALKELADEASLAQAKKATEAKELNEYKESFKSSLYGYWNALEDKSPEAVAMGHMAQMEAFEGMLKKKGVTEQELNLLTSEANKTMENTKKAKQSLEKLLGPGNLIDKITYYDKNDAKFKVASEHFGYKTKVKQFQEGLTPEQEKAIRFYTGSGYSSQNKAAVADMQGQAKTAVEQALLLGEALKNRTIGFDMRLRRNAAQKWFWKALGVEEGQMNDLSESDLGQYIGRTYTEKAFSSVSKRLDFEGAFSNTASESGALKMNIRATKDIRGIDVTGMSNHDHEAEIILDRGVTYVIRRIRKLKGEGKYKYEVDVDAIGHV